MFKPYDVYGWTLVLGSSATTPGGPRLKEYILHLAIEDPLWYTAELILVLTCQCLSSYPRSLRINHEDESSLPPNEYVL